MARPIRPEALMLMLVRDNETPAELAARRREQEATVATIAAAPVQHLSDAFLAAVDGLFPEVARAVPLQRRTRGQ